MKAPFSFATILLVCHLGFVACQPQATEHPLRAQWAPLADTTTGVLGLSAVHIESGEAVSLHGDQRFPMQSVYKFPIALAMLRQVDAGVFSLEDSIQVDSSEYIPVAGHSPLRNQYPNGVTLTLGQLLEYNTAQSDGTACDVLLRLLGGTEKANELVRAIGIEGINIATTEMMQVSYDTVQYQNWATPDAMTELFALFHGGTLLSPESQAMLTAHLSPSNPWFDRRIKGLLQPETALVHKTGSARTYDGLTRATNDAGIITLPDGSHVAITVFLMDSREGQRERETIIAQAAKTAYGYWVGE